MTWSIKLPHRPSHTSLTQLASDCRLISDPEDRRIARECITVGMRAGMQTAGELEELLGSFTATQRKSILDKLREVAHLRSTSDVEATRRMEAATAAAIANPRNLRLYYGSSGEIRDADEEEREANYQEQLARRREVEQQVRREQAAAAAAADGPRDGPDWGGFANLL